MATEGRTKRSSYSELKRIERGLKNALAFHQVVLVRPEEITGYFYNSYLSFEERNKPKRRSKKSSVFNPFLASWRPADRSFSTRCMPCGTC